MHAGAHESAIRTELQSAGAGVFDSESLDVCTFFYAERDSRPVMHRSERSHPRIVSVEHGGAARSEGLDQAALFGGDLVNGGEVAHMRCTDIRDHADVRSGEPREGSHFAGMIDADFNDRHFRPRRDAEQGERQAEFVVQVAFGLCRRHETLQQVGNDVFGGRLAAAAGDGDHGPVPVPSGDCRDRTQSSGRILDAH